MNILVARTHEEIHLAYARLSTAAAIGCDTETSSLNPRFGKILSVQFSDGEFNVLVPVSEGVPLGILGVILADDSVTKIFHNAKFDLEFLTAMDVKVENIFDTMLAEKVLTRGANQSASLAETLYRYFAVDLEKSHRTKFNKSWDGIWTEDLVNYALADVAHLPALMKEQIAWLEKLALAGEFNSQLRKMLDMTNRA